MSDHLGHSQKDIWVSIARGKCPRCRQGDLFQSLMKVRERCPQCDLLLLREPGYFLGAMYIEYGLAVGVVGIVTILLRAGWSLGIGKAVLGAGLLFLPLVPITVRYSRILWIYWDQMADPPA